MKEVEVSELLVVLNDGPVDDANVRVHLPSSLLTPASSLARARRKNCYVREICCAGA